MKKLIGYTMFWIAVGMVLMLIISDVWIAVIIIAFLLIVGYTASSKGTGMDCINNRVGN